MSATRSRRHRDQGSVTIEAAIALSIVVVVLAGCLAGIGCAIAQVRCVDAAREAARLAARGDQAAAAAAVEAVGPAGATLDLRIDAGSVVATVEAEPIGGLLPGIRLTATAVASLEIGAGAVAGNGSVGASG